MQLLNELNTENRYWSVKQKTLGRNLQNVLVKKIRQELSQDRLRNEWMGVVRLTWVISGPYRIKDSSDKTCKAQTFLPLLIWKQAGKHQQCFNTWHVRFTLHLQFSLGNIRNLCRTSSNIDIYFYIHSIHCLPLRLEFFPFSWSHK
jgi:hypothetical protein